MEFHFNNEIWQKSPSTIKRWYLDYRKYGLVALKPKFRVDKFKNNKVTPIVGEFILELVLNPPRLTNIQIYEALIERKIITRATFSQSTLDRYLQNIDVRLPKIESFERRKFLEKSPNMLWVGDTTFGLRIMINGEIIKLAIIGFIDDSSRLIVCCRIFVNDNACNVMATLKTGMLTYGVPKRIYVDNGKSFIAEQVLNSCQILNIRHIRAKPYTPESKGVIERFWKTLKDHWLKFITPTTFKSIEEAQVSLNEFISSYNHKKHDTIGETPFEKFNSGDNVARHLSKDEITQAFLYYEKRLVSNVGTINLKNNEYEIPAELVGDSVRVYYDVDDLDTVYVTVDGKNVACHKVNMEANTHAKRQGIPAK
ncbi:MAG: DDE-type integrase/transposase/recombinase [Acholeplasmatales bacterium]|nr:DDE-type integrase/transposase/recombinase [Acholeplasmatales bacterium]